MQIVTEESLYRAVSNSVKAEEKAYIVTPFIGSRGYDIILDKIEDANDIRFIIDFSDDAVRNNLTVPAAVRGLMTITNHVRSLENLHAKIYLFDNEAIVTSANLSRKAFGKNYEIGVVLKDKKIVAEVEEVFFNLWKKSKDISLEDVERGEEILQSHKNKMKNAGFSGHYTYKGGKYKVPLKKPKSQLNLDTLRKERHVLINVNWSPNAFEDYCSEKQKYSDEQRRLCHEQRRCIGWGVGDGCTSSRVFKDFVYYTSWRAIRNGSIAFLIAKNPNIAGEYYLVGFLYMKSLIGAIDHAGLQHFKADENKSVRLDYSGNKMIKFEKPLIDKLGLNIDWSQKPKGQKVANFVGPRIRKNPRYITDMAAKIILEECYKNTKNSVIKDILEKDFV